MVPGTTCGTADKLLLRSPKYLVLEVQSLAFRV